MPNLAARRRTSRDTRRSLIEAWPESHKLSRMQFGQLRPKSHQAP